MKAKILIILLGAITLAGCATAPPPGGKIQGEKAGQHGNVGKTGADTNHIWITGNLWRKTLYQAAENPHLRLWQTLSTSDVLVEYEERGEKSTNVEVRAYWLLAYSTNAPNHPKPKFVAPTAIAGLEPVPLLTAASGPLTNGYCAVPAADPRSFILWHDGTNLGCFHLPAYRETRGTAWRTVLTPFSVIVDVGGCFPNIGPVFPFAGL